MTPSQWCTRVNAIDMTYSKGNIKQSERLEKLNVTARKELSILSKEKNVLGIEKLDKKLLDTKKYK